MDNNKRKVIFITAPEMFRDEEYYIPKFILEKSGIKVITASLKLGELKGRFGFKTISTMLVKDIRPNVFDGIVYIGGNGAKIFFDNNYALNLAKVFNKQKKITAAICIASVILANAGILNGVKATVFIEGKDSLIKHGAIYTGKSIEIDKNIITAYGPSVAKKFGQCILNKIIN